MTFNLQEFVVHRKNRGNVIGKMTDSLQSITGSGGLKQRYLEFEQAREYCTSLSEKLGTIDKISRRIQKERQGMKYCLNNEIFSILTMQVL